MVSTANQVSLLYLFGTHTNVTKTPMNVVGDFEHSHLLHHETTALADLHLARTSELILDHVWSLMVLIWDNSEETIRIIFQ